MNKFAYRTNEEIAVLLDQAISIFPTAPLHLTDDEIAEKAAPHFRALAEALSNMNREGQEHAMLQIQDRLGASGSPFAGPAKNDGFDNIVMPAKSALCRAIANTGNASQDLTDLSVNVFSQYYRFQDPVAGQKPVFEFLQPEQPIPPRSPRP